VRPPIPRLIASVALAFLVLLAAPLARADDEVDFDKARAAYASKHYDDANDRFRAMLDPQKGTLHDPALIPEARMYWAATLFALGNKTAAAALIEQLLLSLPEYEPDPLRFPQDLVNFFIDTRSRIATKITEAKAAAAKAAQDAHDKDVADRVRAEKRLALLEKLAGEEIEVQDHSRLIALVPFGAGQFQNGNPVLGWALLGTESALAVAAAIAIPVYRLQLAQSSDSFNDGDRASSEQWLSRAETTRDVNLVLAGAFVLTAIAGVVQAEVAFVPRQIETRARPVPNVARVAPFVAPIVRPTEERAARSFTGGVVGIQGSF
jgi:hypothetical protein